MATPGHDEQRRPPPVLVVRPDLPRPAERGRPRQPARAAAALHRDVPHGTQHERDGDDGEPDPAGRAGPAGELGGHRTDGGAADPCRRPRQAHRRDPAAGVCLADHPEGHQDAEDARPHPRRRAGRRPVGVPPDGPRPHELPPARLLLDPGVPDDHEDGDDRQDQHPCRVPPRRRGRRGSATGGPVERDERGRRGEVVDVALARGVRGVEPRGRGGAGHRQDRQQEHPDGQQHPVAAQRQPGERPGPGECAHRCAPTGRRLVVPQEELLERGRPALQAADAERGQDPQDGVELGGSTCRRTRAPSTRRSWTPGRAASPCGGGQLRADRRPGQVPELGPGCRSRPCARGG